MSKLLCSEIAIALICLAGNTQAQIPPASTIPISQSQPTSPTSTPLKATDLSLLTRAIGKFWQTDRAETESQIEIDSSDEKGKTKYFVSVKTIAKVGQKFRSELTILHLRGSANDRVGQKSKIKYTIVSDGKKLYIYRQDLSQYIETNVDELYSTPFISIIGLFLVTFTALDEARRQDLITDILGDNGRILSLSFKPFDRLQVRQQQIDKEILSVHTYSDRDNGPRISGFINSKTALLERIDSTGTDNHNHISMTEEIIKYNRIEMTEKIIKRNSQPTITAKTFTFSPPKGAKKVESLEIGPFKF